MLFLAVAYGDFFPTVGLGVVIFAYPGEIQSVVVYLFLLCWFVVVLNADSGAFLLQPSPVMIVYLPV